MANKVVYLQQDYNNLPAGTPLVEMDRLPPEVQFAHAVVGKPREPTAWYQILGTEVSVGIPRFQLLVDEHHPTAKEVVGPFVCTHGTVGIDKLNDKYSAQVSLSRKYPYMELHICVNTVRHRGQLINYCLGDVLPKMVSPKGKLLTAQAIVKIVERYMADVGHHGAVDNGSFEIAEFSRDGD